MNGSNDDREMTIADKYGFEEYRLTYEEVLALEQTDELKPLKTGKYGKMWAAYMEEEHQARKAFLLAEGLWAQMVLEVQEDAMSMLISLQEQYRKKNPRPTENYMEILHYEDQMRTWAEEVMLPQIVYKIR